MQTGFNRKTFYFESIDADTSLFRLSLAFYFTISWCRLALNFLPDLQPIFEAKSAALIGTQANQGQGMFPWLQQTFVREKDCVTGPKNTCVGGYDQEGPKHAKREFYCLGRLPYKVTG